MRIVLLGAGNVASHLGPALQHAGHELVQVYSRSEESASELAARLQVPFTVHTEDLVSDADIYLFSVRDAVLESLIREVAAGRDDALFVHTAGSISVDVFRNLGLAHGGVPKSVRWILHRFQSLLKLWKNPIVSCWKNLPVV